MDKQVVVVVHAVIGSKKDIGNLLDSIRVELEGNIEIPDGDGNGHSLDVGVEVVNTEDRIVLSEFPDEILQVTSEMMR